MATLVVGGISTNSSEIQETEKMIRARTEAMEKNLLELKRAIEEGVISSEMEVFDVDPGVLYDSDTMEVMYEDKKDKKGDESVLCTVGMGLRRVLKSKDLGNKSATSVEVVKKADIILSSLLEEFKRYDE